MRTLIAIPCLDKIDTEFAECLIRLQQVGDVSVRFLTNSLVYASRDRLTDIALCEKFDRVLWLDSDMTFNSDLLIDLNKDLDDGYDIVSGLCFRRRPPFNPAIWKTIRIGIGEDGVSEEYDDYPKDKLFEVDACGCACVMMKTEVLKAIVEKNRTAFQPISGYGEDLSFCIRAKRMGYKIFCDSRIKIGHLGKTVCDEKTFEAWRDK